MKIPGFDERDKYSFAELILFYSGAFAIEFIIANGHNRLQRILWQLAISHMKNK